MPKGQKGISFGSREHIYYLQVAKECKASEFFSFSDHEHGIYVFYAVGRLKPKVSKHHLHRIPAPIRFYSFFQDQQKGRHGQKDRRGPKGRRGRKGCRGQKGRHGAARPPGSLPGKARAFLAQPAHLAPSLAQLVPPSTLHGAARPTYVAPFL